MTEGLPPLPSLGELPPLPTLGPVTRRVPPGGARREWQLGEVVELRDETPRARTLRLWLPDGYPQVAGQHYVVRVTAEDGTQASRSYSVASAPEPGPGTGRGTHIELTIERLDGGALSPYLHDERAPSATGSRSAGRSAAGSCGGATARCCSSAAARGSCR